MVAGHAEWMWVPRVGLPARRSSRSLLGRMRSISFRRGLGSEQPPRHREPQDLSGAFGDAPRSDATIQPRQGMSLHHRDAARELHRPIHDVGDRLRRHGLGHGHLDLGAVIRLRGPGRRVHGGARREKLHRALAEHGLHLLALAQGHTGPMRAARSAVMLSSARGRPWPISPMTSSVVTTTRDSSNSPWSAPSRVRISRRSVTPGASRRTTKTAVPVGPPGLSVTRAMVTRRSACGPPVTKDFTPEITKLSPW